MPENLKKASEVAQSIVGQLHQNGPLLIGLAICSIIPSFLWTDLSQDTVFISRTISVFLFSYWLLVMWFVRRPIRAAIYHLKNLGIEEKELLKPFLLQDRRTRHLNGMYAPSASLIAKGILVYATSIIPVLNAAVLIQPHAWKYLTKHPELIDLTEEDIGRDEFEDDSPWLTTP